MGNTAKRRLMRAAVRTARRALPADVEHSPRFAAFSRGERRVVALALVLFEGFAEEPGQPREFRALGRIADELAEESGSRASARWTFRRDE